jgi:hypothetical protein
MPDGKRRRRPTGSYHAIFTPPLYADLKTADEWVAYYFLTGAVEQGPENPLARKKYLAGEKECMGRQALVRVLRSDRPLSTTLRKRLAALFDYLSDAAERKLILEFRAEGQRSNPAGNAQVAGYVAYKSKELNSKTEAIAAAAIFFGREEKTIQEMIRKHRQRLKVASTRE